MVASQLEGGFTIGGWLYKWWAAQRLKAYSIPNRIVSSWALGWDLGLGTNLPAALFHLSGGPTHLLLQCCHLGTGSVLVRRLYSASELRNAFLETEHVARR